VWNTVLSKGSAGRLAATVDAVAGTEAGPGADETDRIGTLAPQARTAYGLPSTAAFGFTEAVAFVALEDIGQNRGLVRVLAPGLGLQGAAAGANLGVNEGEIAGAGFAGHVHLHVVPRWAADSNFMAVVGDTRVLPQALEDSYATLRERLAQPS